ncbi:MAG: methionine--tRNA ligase [Deltaproteobacteria bacterium CG11_big_fil_rev_8_21_14_0_20_42_23]|nr:MAG: methionine--tRNA ligase [Deltaproteobacteria bacterium CG11_big_fil_rev_8_21_14_0_20_42_23]PJC65127.1 MAG: methionine--tRNA ligase [Deltaproteobacteria bacterium CG_4_9_14_0_2_um_filter_42_21]
MLKLLRLLKKTKAKTMKNSPYYITTAIDYVNSTPHIGTAYEKIGADILARFHRMLGYDVRFQMGNDEHSINVYKAAKEKGLSPKAYCDEMRKKFEATWKELNISYDGFIQTSDEHHEKGVQKLFQTILDNGDIYSSKYEGWYCDSCEAYYTEKDLVDKKCPQHKTEARWISEDNYFFALRKYQNKLQKYIEKNPDFIQPAKRRNEILGLLREGLEDVSVSRSSFNWGITLPNDPKHIVYVWFDALINYITAIGYGWDEKNFEHFWKNNPNIIHIIGKDITRFHCVIWPAMLMSAGIKLPSHIFGHGFVSFKGEKMSKSLGNVVTPLDITKTYGADALRYYLMREGSFGNDSDFIWENFVHRYNGELANGLGNLVSRTVGMATQYLEGKVKLTSDFDEAASHLKECAHKIFGHFKEDLSGEKGDIQFHNALLSLWECMAAADKYINDTKPWLLAKEKNFERINTILAHVLESLRIVTPLLSVFLPDTAEKMWKQLGFAFDGNLKSVDLEKTCKWILWSNHEIIISQSDSLFPRIELEKKPEQKETPKKSNVKPEKKMDQAQNEYIGIEDFAKVELKIATILEAEKIEGADKLLKFQVELGEEKRQIVSGIAKHFAPEELIGKQVVVVTNLKPVKLRGVESEGMILAASNDDMLTLVSPLASISSGAKVK